MFQILAKHPLRLASVLLLLLPGMAGAQGTAVPAPPPPAGTLDANQVDSAMGTRLLRQPSMSGKHIAFAHGGDLWIVDRPGGQARRLTSTPAVESDPHLSPDGRFLAFSSNRSGDWAVYVMPVAGGNPTRLTWYPGPARARGWTPDGRRILYASSRETAPSPYDRLWTVDPEGGPSDLLPAPFAHRGSYSPDGSRIVIDRVSRWDEEWRGYRGGQNTPLIIMDLQSLDEILVPNQRTIDIHPVWMGERVFFLSDRDWASNIWSYHVGSGELTQHTRFDDADVKTLAGFDGTLVFEQDGWIHTMEVSTGQVRQVPIQVQGDFPWAMPRWVDLGTSIQAASLSATGRRALMQARGEIFTIPVEHGSVRNLTRSPGAADRAPVWSPDGSQVAWFSDDGTGYRLLIGPQDGLGDPRPYDIGESQMAWAPAWAPDGHRIAFVDDRLRIRVIHVDSGEIVTVDTDGLLGSRTAAAPVWSPDSRWLAYAKAFPNHFRRIVVWSVETGETHAVTDAMANAISPAWDRDGRHLWFLASTDLGLGAGWANTSSMQAQPTYGAYVMVLRADDPTPFEPRSDEEAIEDTGNAPSGLPGHSPVQPGHAMGWAPSDPDHGPGHADWAPVRAPLGGTLKSPAPLDSADVEVLESPVPPDSVDVEVRIDVEGIQRRIVALPMPVRSYTVAIAGPAGSVFIGESMANQPGLTLHRFTLEEREAESFVQGVSQPTVSGDGSRILFQSAGQWRVVDTARPPDPSSGTLDLNLQAWIDPRVEWRQIFEEAWRYQRDFFYDPNTHGADWDAVWDRYEPLVEHVRHRDDLNYVLDKVNGELAVGHSFVGGGDLPDVESPVTAALGADFRPENGRWRFDRIYTHESWNPNLTAPLDRPGMRVEEGTYLLAVDGREFTDRDDPYRFLEGTRGRQTVLHVNDRPTMEGAWTETVVPIGSEVGLRQRAWVEDNRRRVDELSGGRLAYVWVPNTGGGGVVSFDRYYFSQQDRPAAVIDERFNGGGLLDDYMVDLMNRDLRAAITNEAAEARPLRLPAGILGPKVLLINERAGSGGDYFPWVFSRLGIGPLIGTRTWGGLVASCAPVPMVDGGFVTSPCNAVFEPGNDWIGENVGIPPDIEVWMDARAVAEGRDPQLERGVEEALRLLEEVGIREVEIPPYPTPARRPGDGR
jgi:tricorn protease